jgi:hypothetical protein
MEHHFNVEDAKKYGVECAILLNNIRFWVAKNKANEKHFYDGKYWTYNSVKAFGELFPYWSKDQIRRYIDKLETAGEIVSGNYNQSHYDRTKWYSLNCQIELANLPNENGENAKPIPYIKTYNKTDSITALPFSFFDSLNSYGFKNNLVTDWLKVRKNGKATNTETAYNSFIKEIEKRPCDINEVLNLIITKSWKGFKWEWYDNEINSNNNFNHKQQQQNELTRIVNEIRNNQ